MCWNRPVWTSSFPLHFPFLSSLFICSSLSSFPFLLKCTLLLYLSPIQFPLHFSSLYLYCSSLSSPLCSYPIFSPFLLFFHSLFLFSTSHFLTLYSSPIYSIPLFLHFHSTFPISMIFLLSIHLCFSPFLSLLFFPAPHPLLFAPHFLSFSHLISFPLMFLFISYSLLFSPFLSFALLSLPSAWLLCRSRK